MQYDENYFKRSSNKKALLMWLVLASVLTALYVIETAEGLRTMDFLIQYMLFSWIPFALGLLVLKIKGMATDIYKDVIAFGYGTFYTFVLLTSNNPLVYTNLLPLTSMLILYKNRNYMIRCGIANLIVLAVYIGINIHNGNDSPSDMSQYEIQVITLVLCYAGYVLSINHLYSSDGAILSSMQKNLDKVVHTVETVKVASNDIVDGMSAVRELADENIIGATTVVNSMANLTTNNSELRQRTSSSLNLTEVINKQVENVALMINQMVVLASESTKHSKASSEELSEVVRLSTEVEEVLHEFKNQFKAMADQINIIESITMQTNILSLNASVEAARAGSAGKGFAVVAGEIRELSGKTKASSDSIFAALQHLGNTSNKMTDSITKTLEKVRQVDQSVEKIAADTTQMGENIQIIDKAIIEVKTSNTRLVDNMQDVSNIVTLMTESISDSDEITKAMQEKNIETTNNVADVETTVGKLMEELGVIGVMGIKDIKAGQVATVSTNDDEFNVQIKEVLEDGVFVEFLQNKKSPPTKSCTFVATVDNSYYKWDNVELTITVRNGVQEHKVILTKQPSIVNRRKYNRVPLNCAAQVTILDTNHTCHGEMVNISAGGYAFRTNDVKIASAKNKLVRLSIDGITPFRPDELDAKVIRVGRDAELNNIGCRFLHDNIAVAASLKNQ